MAKLYYKILSSLLIFCLVFPLHVVQASNSEKQKPTIAIIPVAQNNGENTEINNEFAIALRNSIKDSYNIINTDLSKQIGENAQSNEMVSQELAKALNMIKEGRDAYILNDDKNNAALILESAEEFLVNHVRPSHNSSHALVSSKLTRAWVLHETGDKEIAREILKSILDINPTYQFDTKGFSNSFRKFIQDLNEGDQRQKGTLDVSTIPSSVDVYVNGLYLGASPLNIELPQGKYILGFSSNGRKSVIKKITVDSNQNKKIQAALKWDNFDENEKPLFGGLIWSEASIESKTALAGHISNATNADKTVFITISKNGNSFQPEIQVFDKKYNQALKTIRYKHKIKNLKSDAENIVQYFSKSLKPYLEKEPTKLWRENIDNSFISDQRIAMRPKKPLYAKPAFWAVVGGVVLTGVALGIALSTGNSSNSADGSVVVDFGGFEN